MPSIAGGLDIHRKQITSDYADTVTGQVLRGQAAPADRAHFRAWLAGRFERPEDVAFAVEACTGWRYVAEELAAAGLTAHLAGPADTATLRGRKKRVRTDRAGARLMRGLLAEGRLPECWIPPAHVLECRALLECYHDLRAGHTAWVQRAHAVLFHQGAPEFYDLSRAAAPAGLTAVAGRYLSPAGQAQVSICLRMLAAVEAELDGARRRLLAAARRMRGAKVPAESIYGAGPVTARALTCWLGGAGRFSSACNAVRFAGLDITVYSSDGKRSPGHLSRQGPPVLRWALYEAGKTHARPAAPDHGYYAQVKDRKDGNRAALAEARKIVRRACHLLAELGDDALAPVVRTPHGWSTGAVTETGKGAIIKPMRHQLRPAPASPLPGRLRPAARGTRRTASKD
jgi:transposase